MQHLFSHTAMSFTSPSESLQGIMLWYLLDYSGMRRLQGAIIMRRNVGRPSIPAHKRKTRIHLSIAPTLIEEIDNDRRWNQSRSQYIVSAIKKQLSEEEPLMLFIESDAIDCLTRLFSMGVLDYTNYSILKEKVREAPEKYTIQAETNRKKQEYEENNRNEE